jgi:hypothetical protein
MPRTTGSGSPTSWGFELSGRIRCASALWIGLAALLACGEREQSSQPRIGTVQFRYAPPDGTAYVETSFTRVRVRSASRLRGWHETEEKVGVEIARSESGFLQTAEGVARRTWLNGIAYNDPRNASFVGRELTYHIDPAGRLTAVGGVRELVSGIHGGSPKQRASQQSQNERAILDRLQDQWNRAIGDLAGKSLAIGETVETKFPFRLPGGDVIAMPEKVLALRFVACPAGRCVLVLQDYQSDDGSLAAYVREALKGDPIVAAQGARAAPTGTRVASSTSRVIDPETMRIYQEDGSESAIFTLDVPGHGPLRFERIDEGRRRFEYR